MGEGDTRQEIVLLRPRLETGAQVGHAVDRCEKSGAVGVMVNGNESIDSPLFTAVAKRVGLAPASNAALFDDGDMGGDLLEVGQDVRRNDHGTALAAKHAEDAS